MEELEGSGLLDRAKCYLVRIIYAIKRKIHKNYEFYQLDSD